MHLRLFVPEWQGYAVDNSPHVGAVRLRNSVFLGTEFQEIEVLESEELSTENQIMGFQSVEKTMSNICQSLEEQQPDSTFLLGGTCGAEVAPVSYLNDKYDGDLAVIWFDAHGDLNTPESSPSGHFHGMPVRTLLGEGNRDLCQMTFSKLESRQIFLVGTRELDPPEAAFVEQNQISKFPAKFEARQLINSIRNAGFSRVYVHFDLDVLDPTEFGEMIFHIQNGMTCELALELVALLKNEFSMVGASLLEFVPRGGDHDQFLEQLSQLLLSPSN